LPTPQNTSYSYFLFKFAGLILYNGQQLGGSGDFLSFGLNGGVPEFRFSTGLSPVIIRGNRPLKIGQWHTAKLMRINREGKIFTPI
jgi:basement membrane-specific heparan sulfate proteoglycan core protein